MTLTYLQFHLLFLVPPLLVLAAATRWGSGTPDGTPRLWGYDARGIGIALMAAAAFVYTTPWDNYLISVGAWGYGEGTVLFRVGYVPFGEYLFFVVQPVLTALWLYRFPLEVGPLEISVPERALGVGLGGAVSQGDGRAGRGVSLLDHRL